MRGRFLTYLVSQRHRLVNLVDGWRIAYLGPGDTWEESGPTDVVCFSADANRMDTLGGRAVDRIMDPLKALMEEEGYSTVTIASPGDRITGNLAATSTLSVSKLVSGAQIRDLARHPWRALRNEQRPHPYKAAAYTKLLQNLQPKIIFAFNADAVICQVAGHLRIPVLEVLHARGYTDVYEEWKSRKISELPDGVIAYDDLSAESFGRLLPTLKVPNFRLPFELEMARQFMSVSPPPFSENAVRNRHVILFTASYSHQDPSWPGGLPLELVELARENSDVFLLVRLHPVMRSERKFGSARKALESLLQNLPNCDLDWASKAPLYAVLDVSTIHFTYDSMSAYEAADVGILTFAQGISGSTNKEHMRALRKLGYVIEIPRNKSGFEAALKHTFSQDSRPRQVDEVNVSEIVGFANSSCADRWALFGA